MKPSKAKSTVSPHRLKDNPMEKRFVRAWRKINEAQGGVSRKYDHLRYLLSENKDLFHPEAISDRDCQVAETVVQWLGSPVGSKWLEDVLNPEKKDRY